MWCLHVLVETFNGGSWTTSHQWVWRGPVLRPKRPVYRNRVDTKVLPLYAVLSGAWKTHLVEERDTLFGTKGVPDNLAPKTDKYLKQYDHRHFHKRTIKPFEEYPWQVAVKRFHRLSPKALEHWETTSVVPVWADDDPEDIRTEEVVEKIEPVDLWGREWLDYALPRIKSYEDKQARVLTFFTEEAT